MSAPSPESAAIVSSRIPAALPSGRDRLRRSRRRPVGPDSLERVIRIHERLGLGRPATAVSLARELEVSDRTIKRDIELMRDRFGVSIVWEPSTKTYFYDRPCDLLPLLRLDADETLALVLAGRTFSAWAGSPLGRALTGALDKIAGVVGGAVSVPLDALSGLVSQPDESGEGEFERRFMAVALEAIRRRRELQIVYHKPGATRTVARTVHPLHLAFLEHRWMLVAHDPERRARRNFLLGRIREAKATGNRFEPPGDFDLRAYLRGSLGRFTGDGDHEVRIAFDATAAPYVREHPWHASQAIVPLMDGGIEVSLRLNNLIDVQRRVLACGRHAEVLAPSELREAIRAEAAAMFSLHTPPTREPLVAETPESYSPGHPASRIGS